MASISSKNLEVQIANRQHHHQRREQRDEAIDSNSTGSFHPRPSVLYTASFLLSTFSYGDYYHFFWLDDLLCCIILEAEKKAIASSICVLLLFTEI